MTIFTWKNLLANLWTNWLEEIESFAKGLEANTEKSEFAHRAWFFCLTCFLCLRAGVCKPDSLPSLEFFFSRYLTLESHKCLLFDILKENWQCDSLIYLQFIMYFFLFQFRLCWLYSFHGFPLKLRWTSGKCLREQKMFYYQCIMSASRKQS